MTLLLFIFGFSAGVTVTALIWLISQNNQAELLRSEKETTEACERALKEVREKTEAEIRASIR